MRSKLSFFFMLILLVSCNADEKKRPATSQDTGRDFIRATLDGDFKTAEPLLLKETESNNLFQSYKIFYERLPAEKKIAYKNASYNINTYKDVNDSVTLINYSNSYMNKPMNIKLIKKDKQWFVDFKYTSDTTGIE